MKTVLKTVAIGAACAAFMGSPLAQKIERIDFGKREFDANCASCHGISGKGNGPLAAVLTTRPTDLTQLAKRNDGVLPMARLYEVIDGANVPLHGTPANSGLGGGGTSPQTPKAGGGGGG